ncbi:TetR/AcrR family transcriptional regulator [Bacillus sp. V59.32b]|uniref:TetR/AcrR family transcriptional regulator n=1 Tax=Bacillus sp. V59.32b TaxID=1758642 RepID=UPI000E3D47B0|nr:TetR/AcrR family transcriptional regulator [Bacillus sp. V59.32b]RFU69294.1 TetR/AcrR family transcriptional regulator [Bacillus sp. V59.32b]
MKEQKLTKRKERSIQTKQNIYDVALELMKNISFNDVTIEEISKKAGVSVGSFYYYFSSKEDIYLKLFKQMDEELFQDFDVKGQTGPVDGVIQDFFIQLARYITELGLNITRYNLFTDHTIFYEEDLYMNIALQNIIKLGQTNEQLTTDMSEKEMTNYLLVIVRGIVLDWCVNNGDYSLEEKIMEFMKRILSSVKS